MRGRWVFVGRQDELARMIAAVGNVVASGLVLGGAAGVGKSSVMREGLRRLDSRKYKVLIVLANKATSTVPLGAFAPLLPVEFPAPPERNLLRWVAERLVAAASGRRLVLAVDDAHHLDPSSAAVALQLASSTNAFVLATVRDGEVPPDAVTALWKEGFAERLELRPFDRREILAVLEAALGGQVEEMTAAQLSRTCRGTLLFLRELVRSGVASRALTDAGGLWRFSGELGVTPQLLEVVSDRIGALTEEEQYVLEVVAFGEPLMLDTLTRLCELDVLERVEERGLIAIERPGRVRLAHPMYGEVVRTACPTMRVRRIRCALADAVESSGSLSDPELLRIALWRLEGGAVIEPDRLLAACRLAWAGHDLPRAIKLGHAAAAAGGGVPAALLLGEVLNWAERYDEAEKVLLPLTEVPMTDEQRMDFVAARVQNLAFGLHDLHGADAVLLDADQRLTDTTIRRQFASYTANHRFWSGDCTDALHRSTALLAQLPDTTGIEVNVLGDAALALSHAGRSEDAIIAVVKARRTEECWTRQFPVVQLILDTAAHYAHLFAGRLEAAERAAVDLCARPNAGAWPLALAAGELMQAHVARLRGHLEKAARHARTGASLSGTGALLRSSCLGELAHVEALRRNVTAAAATLAAADECWVDSVRPFQYWVDLARPWVTVCAGSVDEAVEVALRAAAQAREHGFRGFEVLSLHDVVRLGRAGDVADRLAELASEVDGEWVLVAARHARASASGDAHSLERLSKEFVQLGFVVYAAEAAAQAAQVYHARGASRQTQRAAARSGTLAQRSAGANTPALHLARAPGLTTRELEIARMAAAGMPSAAIATQLVISTRTVDNHLHHVFAKLGITRRTELADALDVRHDNT